VDAVFGRVDQCGTRELQGVGRSVRAYSPAAPAVPDGQRRYRRRTSIVRRAPAPPASILRAGPVSGVEFNNVVAARPNWSLNRHERGGVALAGTRHFHSRADRIMPFRPECPLAVPRLGRLLLR